MAITNAQQARQLYKRGTGLGGADTGRQDAESQYGGASYDSGSNQSGREQSYGGGRNPMRQFDDPNTKAAAQKELARREEKIGFGDKTGLSSLPSIFAKGLNLFKVRRGNEFAQGFNRSLRDLNRVDMSGNTRGGDTPLWAELGFNSEAEYLAALAAQGASTEEQEPEIEEDEGLFRRYRAEGGIMNTDVVGGEMDFESARQMYGLGKLVKKVTRSVKKIAKSPIGKVAIAAGLSGIPFGGGSFFGSGSLFGKAKPFLTDAIFGKVKSFGTPVEKGFGVRSGGLFDLIKKNPFGTIAGVSAVSGLLTAEQEEEAQLISDETGIDIAEIRANPNKYLARRFRAEGGSTEGKEPVAKKVMPLLDMDGQEKDYRETGGFVDMGRMEKADDVPARLSKNEFVFTADAVRNAGDGSVDKGAEVMYNMMKNLESGGDVSEESQGLEGARKMFQTSQRLEEVL